MAYEGYGSYEAAGGERYSTGPSQIPPTGHTGYTDWPYYVVAEGIQHEVIQTDIGRWLGNDAVVRRHTFEVRYHCSAALEKEANDDCDGELTQLFSL
jgi:hypothetical protein